MQQGTGISWSRRCLPRVSSASSIPRRASTALSEADVRTGRRFSAGDWRRRISSGLQPYCTHSKPESQHSASPSSHCSYSSTQGPEHTTKSKIQTAQTITYFFHNNNNKLYSSLHVHWCKAVERRTVRVRVVPVRAVAMWTVAMLFATGHIFHEPTLLSARRYT